MKPLAVLALTISLAASAAEALTWGDDIDQAVRKAAQDGKPVLVEFSAAWNPWCQALAEKTYPDEGVQDLLGRFVRVRVDAEKHPELMKRFKVEKVPTLIVLDAKGAEVRRIDGFKGITRMTQELSKGLMGDGTVLPPEAEPGQSDPQNPLPEMAKDMRQAKERLDAEDTGRGTQDLQQKLLTQLDELIEQAQQASSSSSGSGSGEPKPKPGGGQPQNSNGNGQGGGEKGATSSSNASRPTSQGNFNPVDQKAKDWGHLPPQEREKILQELRETYPPEYVEDIEKYFKQLSESGH